MLRNKLGDKAVVMHSTDKAYKRADTIDFLITFLMVITAVLAIRAFVFEPVAVSGTSMETTLMDTEKMFAEKFTYWFSGPHRGDIVITHYPDTYKPGDKQTRNATFVKRVIGLPGDTLKMQSGIVYIKPAGQDEFIELHEESYLVDDDDYMYPNNSFAEYTVPEGYVFVMGDHRSVSLDSRYPSVGPIPLNYIVGRVHGVILPVDRARTIDSVKYDGLEK